VNGEIQADMFTTVRRSGYTIACSQFNNTAITSYIMDMVSITAAIMFWDSLTTEPVHYATDGQTSYLFGSNTITLDIKCDWQKDAIALYKVVTLVKRNQKKPQSGLLKTQQ